MFSIYKYHGRQIYLQTPFKAIKMIERFGFFSDLSLFQASIRTQHFLWYSKRSIAKENTCKLSEWSSSYDPLFDLIKQRLVIKTA